MGVRCNSLGVRLSCYRDLIGCVKCLSLTVRLSISLSEDKSLLLRLDKGEPSCFFLAGFLSSTILESLSGLCKKVKQFRTLAALVAIILSSLIFPLLIGDPSLISIAVEVLLLTGAAVAWNLFSGYTGYISLGHAAYFGIGAYVLALVCQDWHISGGYEPFLFIPLAGLVAGACSMLLGLIALRARQYTFMVITIALFFIFQLLAFNLQDFTGGTVGIFLPPPNWNADLYTLPFYYIALALLLLATFVSWWIRCSRFGLLLLAIRDDEDRSRGLGIRVGRHKLAAYIISASFTGMIGALAIYFAGLITPSSAFDQTLDITIVTLAFFGGVGTVVGPLVGGLLLEPLQIYLNQQYGSTALGINQVLFGCFLLVVILLMPKGFVPALHTRWQTWITPARQKRAARLMLPSENADASEVIPSELVGSPVFQENLVQGVPMGQQPKQIAWSLPHRPSQQTVVALSTLTNSQKVRALRLQPISSDKPSSAARQGQMRVSGTTNWRCPLCRRPFLLSGNTCYCPRCGVTRPLSEE